MSRIGRIARFAVPMLVGGTVLAAAEAQAACNLQSPNGQIKHVIYLTFDNVHLRRDNPNVPSDMEQMPNLLNFLLQNGTVSGNHHTPLISHTADDILTALTGVYGDRHGQPVSNSYGFFNPDGSVGFASSFLYWTARRSDGTRNLINENGLNPPAPWVPFTRAGCDVGAFSTADIELERTPDDVVTFFGAGSPEAASAVAADALPNTPANQPAKQAPTTDFLGIAVHCAQNGTLCSGSNANHARPDPLPDEPGGYAGFQALFGNVHVAPVICAMAPKGCDSNGHVLDTNGNVIADAYGRPGFPNGFSPTAAQSLGYAATMLEAGAQVVYLYIADAHDRNPVPLDPATNRPGPNHAFGPGEAEYVAQLKAYDAAFGKFFARLTADGITKDNTLFVVVPDENDHFVGSAPTPPNCNGITIFCTYQFASEINAHLNRLLLTQRNNGTPFAVHSDDAPTIYINGNPAPTASVTRTMEHDLDALTATNPITGGADKLSVLQADQAEMKLLHMVTTDPSRTPTLTMFGDDNYFFFNFTPPRGSPLPPCTVSPSCVSVPVSPGSTFAWNHGDFQEDITRTWMGMVGPGVTREGRNDTVFSDHTDVRPTMMVLVGLKDSYVHDGRVLIEKLNDRALPNGLRRGEENYVELAQALKRINAPLGSVGRNSLVFANRSITGGDAAYAAYLTQIGNITSNRDGLGTQIKSVLNAAAFGNQPVDERQEDSLLRRANQLADQVEDLANGPDPRRQRDRDDNDGRRHDD